MGKVFVRDGTLCAIAFCMAAFGQVPEKPKADVSNFSYGPHERQRFDLYLADVDRPAPLVVYIHGGGFRGGSKDSLNAEILRRLLAGGIHVAALEYRLLKDQPLPTAHYDSLRGLQTMRAKAAEWKIDKSRIAAFGGSAGAQICMWLAFHDEMSEPESDDPVERESSRLAAVATTGGQTTMEQAWWLANVPGYDEPHREWSEYFWEAEEDQVRIIVENISALSLISADDPPIHMHYRMPPDEAIPSNPGQATSWKVHHVAFGEALLETAGRLGVEAYLEYPGRVPKYANLTEFFLAKLGTH